MMRLNLSAALAAVLFASAASAGGLLPDSAAALAPAVRARYAKEITRARAQDSEAFAIVDEVVRRAESLDARKRGRLAPISPLLKRLKARVVWPAVEKLVFAAQGAPTVPSARTALDVGLIEVAGAQRDPRLAPLWEAILDSDEARYDVLRAAAEGLAKLDSDDAAAKLVSLSRTEGRVRAPVLAAMGHCRRLVVARALAWHLDREPDALTAKRIAQSLADAGSAWAWRTPAVKARSEEGAVRRTAAEALVRAVVAREGEVRQAASDALMVVDAPETPALVEAAKRRANPEQGAALDRVLARFRRNPAR